MKINNKKAWNVKRKDINGEYVIYENYEKEFIDCLKSIWLGSKEDKVTDIVDNSYSYIFIYNCIMWQISDNGGEINIEVVNGQSISIPYTDEYFAIKPIDLAYRVSVVLRWGKTDLFKFPLSLINWKERTSDEKEKFMYNHFNI